jgi:protein-disulfide isomerase
MGKRRRKIPRSPSAPTPPQTAKTTDMLGLIILVGLVGGLVSAFATWQRLEYVAESVESRLGRIELQASQAVRNAVVNPLPSTPPQRRGPDPDLLYDIDTDGAPVRGAVSAPVTIVEFSDFHCPFCVRAMKTLERVQTVYDGQVKLVWKHLPQITLHPQAPEAHVASVAAQRQGRFWEFHDKVFNNNKERNMDAYRRYARELGGLDMERFEQDLVDLSSKETVDADVTEAQLMQITSTPAFFINGRYLRGAKPFEEFAGMINDELERLGLPVPAEVSGL